MLKHMAFFILLFTGSLSSAYANGGGATAVAGQLETAVRTSAKHRLQRPTKSLSEQYSKTHALRSVSTNEVVHRKGIPVSAVRRKKTEAVPVDPEKQGQEILAREKKEYEEILATVREENRKVGNGRALYEAATSVLRKGEKRKKPEPGMTESQMKMRAERIHKARILKRMRLAYQKFLERPHKAVILKRKKFLKRSPITLRKSDEAHEISAMNFYQRVWLASRKSDAAGRIPAVHSYIAISDSPHGDVSAFFSVQQHGGYLKIRDTMQNSDMIDWKKNPSSLIEEVKVHPDYVKRSIKEAHEQQRSPDSFIPPYHICKSNCNSATHERLMIAMGYQLADYEGWLKRKKAWVRAHRRFSKAKKAELNRAIQQALDESTPLPDGVKSKLITPRDLDPRIWKMTEPPDPKTIKYAWSAKGAGTYPFTKAREKGMPALSHVNKSKGAGNCVGCALATDLTLRGVEAPSIRASGTLGTDVFFYRNGAEETFENLEFMLNPDVLRHTGKVLKPVGSLSELSKRLAEHGTETTAIISYQPLANQVGSMLTRPLSLKKSTSNYAIKPRRHMVNAKVLPGKKGTVRVIGFDGQKNRRFVLHKERGASDIAYAVTSSSEPLETQLAPHMAHIDVKALKHELDDAGVWMDIPIK